MSILRVQKIRHTASDTDVIDIANDGTCRANITNNLSNRNKIINGAMTISQRHGASSVQLSASEQYIIDRFENDTGSSFDMKADASQSTDAPDGFSNSLKLACDGVSAVSAASNGMITTFLEGQDVQDLAFGTSNAKSVTLSFYAKSSSQNNGHVYGVFLGAYLNGTRNSQTKGFTVTSSWQRFTMTFEGTGTATNTAINNDNLKGFQIGFSLAAGSNDQVSYSTWTADSGLKGFTGQDNFFDNTSNEIYITGVQLEVGSVATDFEHRSFAQELALCQRYFYMHASGAFPLSNTDRCPIGHGYGYTSTDGYVFVTYPVQMRTNPSLFKVVGSNYFNFAHNNNNAYPDNILANRVSNQVCELNFYQNASWAQNDGGMLRTYNTAARVGFSAEL